MNLKVILVATIGFAPITVHASPFTSLIDFGDSLSDAGNDYAATFGLLPGGPGYYNGRFSNGPVWVEHLGQSLGLGAVTPSLTGGTDYAFGGVTSGTGTTDGAPNVETQILGYTLANAATASQLYTVLGGANDLFNVLDGSATPAQAVAAANTAADNITAGVGALYADGARNILVGNLPDLGDTPAYRGTLAQSSATALTVAFDTRLAADLATLQATSTGLNLYNLNLYGLYTQVLLDKQAYGISDTTDQAYTGDNSFSGKGTAVADPSGYLFWDDVHPTATTHALIAAAALAAIPEPSVGMLTVFAAGLFLARPRAAVRRLRAS